MKIARNAAAAVVQVVIGAVLLFILYRVILDTLGVESLGIWSVVLATASASRIGELGLSTGVTRFVAKYRALGDDAKVSSVLQTGVISVAALLLVVITLALPLLQMVLGHLFPEERLDEALALLPFLMASLILSAVAGIFQSGLQGCQKYVQTAVLVSISNLLFVITGLWLAPGHGLQGLAWAQIGQGVFLAIGGWILLRLVVPGLPLLPWRWNKQSFREMLGYGAQVQLAGVAMMLFDPLTKALLSKFGGLSTAGYFEMANQLVSKVRMLIVAANQVIVPRVAELNEGQHDGIKAMYRTNLRVLFLVVPVTMGLLIGWAPVVSEVWIGHYAPTFVLFAALRAVFWAINIFCGPAYFSNQGRGRLFWNTAGHVWMGLANALLGFLLGWQFGGTGVVIGAGLALVSGSFPVIYGFHRDLAIPWKTLPYREASAGILAAVLSALTGLYGYSLLESAPLPVRWGLCWLAPLPILVLMLWSHPLVVIGRGRILALNRRRSMVTRDLTPGAMVTSILARRLPEKDSNA